jgi:hypothetical protein
MSVLQLVIDNSFTPPIQTDSAHLLNNKSESRPVSSSAVINMTRLPDFVGGLCKMTTIPVTRTVRPALTHPPRSRAVMTPILARPGLTVLQRMGRTKHLHSAGFFVNSPRQFMEIVQIAPFHDGQKWRTGLFLSNRIWANRQQPVRVTA